jgi:superfamily II DNA/RNA helicase
MLKTVISRTERNAFKFVADDRFYLVSMNVRRVSYQNSLKMISSAIGRKHCDIVIEAPLSGQRTTAFVGPLIKNNPPSTSGLPQVMVVAPTLQDVDRIAASFDRYRERSAKTLTVFSGTDVVENKRQLRCGCDYLIGTPGRLELLERDHALQSSGLSAVVFEKANMLLASAPVLNFIHRAIPAQTQRIFVADSLSEWHKDTLKDLTRKGHALERFQLEVGEEALPCELDHLFSKMPAEGFDVRQLRLLVETKSTGCIIVCKSTAEVSRLALEPLLFDFIPLTANMSEAVQKQQSHRYRQSPNSTLVTTDECVGDSGNLRAGLLINLGSPRGYRQYVERARKWSRTNGRIVTLLHPKDTEVFGIIKSQSGLTFSPFEVDYKDDQIFMMNFKQTVLRAADAGGTVSFLPKEAETLLKLEGSDLVGGLSRLLESRRDLFIKRSPLSGEPDYIPVLLFDPFRKKVKDPEAVDKLIKSSSKSKIKVGRIALSAKGYVVDVPSDLVAEIVDSKKLKERNIKAICLSELPPLVEDESSFAAKQARRDKEYAMRLLRSKKRK